MVKKWQLGRVAVGGYQQTMVLSSLFLSFLSCSCIEICIKPWPKSCCISFTFQVSALRSFFQLTIVLGMYNFGYIAGTNKTVFVSQPMKLETFTYFIDVFSKISVVFLLYFCPKVGRQEYKWVNQKVSNKRNHFFQLIIVLGTYNFGYIVGTKKTVFVSQLMKLETFTHFIEVFGKISVVF